MTQLLAERVRELLKEEPRRSMFRCTECGSSFESPRVNPETRRMARKCVSCPQWYPVPGSRARVAS